MNATGRQSPERGIIGGSAGHRDCLMPADEFQIFESATIQPGSFG
jgi:hypothetical protein